MPDSLLTPWFALGCLILAAAALSLVRGVPGRVRAASLAALTLFGGASLPYTANLALGHLEQRARALQARCGKPPRGSVFIVLAGGIRDSESPVPHVVQLSADSLRRLIGAEHLAVQVPDSMLVLSGGAGTHWKEADLMRELALRLGFPASRILTDRDSHTTLESAYTLRRLLQAGHVSGPLYLVTSAYHMPRAMLSFRISGVKVCALPVDFQAVRESPWEMLMPSLDAMHKTALVVHEYLGDLYYRWRRTPN